jgi:flagellar hook protein FlgE
MGIYSALSTAVTGLRAQSFALENISGNIMNSQTTGFKRIETDFVDLIPDAPLKRQSAGAVLSQSRATNDLGGDIKTADKETFMAISGNGFFVVEPAVGRSDGATQFSGANFYTRRGDFQADKSGYLVNGSGYFLKGLPIDPTTGNVAGSVPEVIQISSNFLPAQPTTRLNYQLNLPQLPNKVKNYQEGVVGSELLRPSSFMAVAPDTPATASGTTGLTGTANASTVMTVGQTLTLKAGSGNTVTFEFYDGNGGPFVPTTPGNLGIDVQTVSAVSIDAALADIQTKFRANGGTFATTAAVSLVSGTVTASLGSNTTAPMTVGGTAAGLALTAGVANPVRPSLNVRVPTIAASADADFKAQSIQGGAITVYASNGSPVDVQLRWAKINSAESGGVDRWNLFYMSDSAATGTSPMWTRVNQDYTFGADGSMTPPIEEVPLTGVTINGVSLGNMTLRHGAAGVTQFSNPNGTASVKLSQNGYGAGEFQSVAINDGGRVVASYSNGQQVELAQVVIANFNASNSLKRMDGGAFAATSESGEASLDNGTGVVGSSLESSNTDISEEFTKLIVTQQAYAAGTRIVSTANDMLQEALNMVR